MIAPNPEPLPFERERYELYADPIYRFSVSRRDVFKMLGAGIVVLLLFGRSEESAFGQESGGGRRGGFRGGPGPEEISAWLHFGENGRVTVFTGKVEVGQNTRTALALAVAEELRVPLASIEMVMGDTDRTPFDMGTFGSRSTPDMSPRLRKAAAEAREWLMDRAAAQWQADRGDLAARDGKVVDAKGGRSVPYETLAQGQTEIRAVRDDAPLTPAADWRVMGHPAHKIDGRLSVTGARQFASDIRRPGMLHGKILRPSAFGAKLASLDTKKAEAIPGVIVVHDGDFVGVAAPNTRTAMKALEAIAAEWSAEPQPSHRTLFDDFKKNGGDGNAVNEAGDLAAGLAAADKKLSHVYTLPYIAHAPLEPRAAVAEWADGRLTVWTGTQRPFGVRGDLAGAFQIPETQVHVLMPDCGAGYGGKHTGEAAMEAARLAKAAGKPVKVNWTREEEFTWAYFRPAGVMEVISGVKNDGAVTAWEFHNYNSGTSGIGTYYDIPNQRIVFHGPPSPLRQGSYRGLAATANHFARESHMDELAHAVGMEPLQFRLKNLKDERLRAVFQAAAERFGWGKAKPAGHGFGIAGGFEKGGYVATCAEVTADLQTGKIRVLRAVTAFDCGAVVSPDQLKNQIEGAFIMGIGGALYEGIQFENGKILNAHFSDYRMPRFSDAPAIDVVLIDRKDQPSAGAGETPIVGCCPAIANAVFDATGIRLRSMPLRLLGAKKEA